VPHIPNPSGLPGVAGLMAYRRTTGDALRAFTQALMRGDSSLTAAERELVATYVSSRNGCRFCTRSHAAVARRLGSAIVDDVIANRLEGAPPKTKALLAVAEHVRTSVAPVPLGLVEEARRSGVDDVAIHDAVLVAAAFCMFNRYVEGLDATTPEDGGAYETMADRLAGEGYARHPVSG